MIITGFPYHFFEANQRKVDVKMLSWTECAISKDWRDWHILAGNDERTVWQNLNRFNWKLQIKVVEEEKIMGTKLYVILSLNQWHCHNIKLIMFTACISKRKCHSHFQNFKWNLSNTVQFNSFQLNSKQMKYFFRIFIWYETLNPAERQRPIWEYNYGIFITFYHFIRFLISFFHPYLKRTSNCLSTLSTIFICIFIARFPFRSNDMGLFYLSWKIIR